MFYADDSVLLAPSSSALQKLLDICFKYACDYELKYNIKKTECMCVKPKWLKQLKMPDLFLGGRKLNFTSAKKYLGCFICDDLTDNHDIKRQVRCVYTRGNVLVKTFRHCSDDVKLKLFKSYCTGFYGCTLWAKFTDSCKHKLVVAYKQIFRNIMKCQKLGTTGQMLKWNVVPYDVIIGKLIYGFKMKLFLSDSFIVQSILRSLHFYSTVLYKQWNKVLFSL